jgi:hypothetical protein
VCMGAVEGVPVHSACVSKRRVLPLNFFLWTLTLALKTSHSRTTRHTRKWSIASNRSLKQLSIGGAVDCLACVVHELFAFLCFS